MKTKKMLCAVVMVMMLAIMFTVPAFAAGTGDVAGAIEGTWTDASAQIKTVVNNVVFPVIDLVLAVFFFAKLGMAYFDYRKHGQFEWTAPAILFACLIINLPHPTSAKHPRMPLSDRAAQFAPFAALSGHSAALVETARLTDQRMELDEDARAALDSKQQLLLERIKERPEITATWFQPDEKKDGGRYIVSTGRLKRIHEADQVLILADGLRIPIGDIVELESECIRGLL